MHALPDYIVSWDQQVLEVANSLVGKSPLLDFCLEAVAAWLIYLVPILLLGIWFYLKFRSSKVVSDRVNLAMIAIAGVFSWQVLSRLVKMFYFRPRPASAGENVRELFFHRPDESFPSDHAALLFGLAIYCYLSGQKKVGHWTVAAAVAVSVARVVTGTHWASDIIGGVIVGLVGAVAIWLIRKPLEKYLVQPLVEYLTKLGI